MHKKLGLASLLALFILAGCRINTAPKIIVFAASPSSGEAPLSVAFAITATDGDGDPLTCTLNYGDGSPNAVFSCSHATSRQHNYSVGNYTATLAVSDGRGGNANATVNVSVSQPSTPSGACPLPGSSSLGTLAVEEQEPRGLGDFANAAYVPGELLVRQQSGVSLQSARVATLENELGLKRLSTPGLNGWVRYQVPAGGEEDLASQILSSGLGEYVQPNYRYMLLADPNDTYYNSYQKTQYDLMHITEAWNELPTDPCRPIVGVIDSGVADDHPDLDANIVPGRDVSDNDDDPYPEAGSYHGTMVASIFGAETNNGRGMASDSRGIAYIMPLKIFPNATSSTIAGAINWARQRGVHVLNMSVCILNNSGDACADLTNNPDATIEDALRDAYNDGIVSFAASGNYNDSFVGYPASSPYTIAVGATDNDDPPHRADEGDWCPSSNPNCGSGSNYGSRLDVMAPGTDVLGAGVPDSTDSEPYMHGSGTSFASPYAAGVAALYISRYYATENDLPGPDLVRDCMRSTAQDLGSVGVDDETGAGLVRADQMLDTTNSVCYP